MNEVGPECQTRGFELAAPPNVIAELELSLAETICDLARDADRLSQLAELHRAAVAVALRLGRPVAVFDVFDAARTDDERQRLELLARCLRSA